MSPVARGGGASRSTEAAAGTSAATDVSLRELISVEIKALDRHLTDEIKALKELLNFQRGADQEAIKKAFDASQELAAKHNDLIRTMEKKDATYATKTEVESLGTGLEKEINRLSSWQSRLTGGMLVVAAIGVANLVKVWVG